MQLREHAVRALRHAKGLLTGRQASIEFKRAFHADRRAMEERFLRGAARDPGLMRTVGCPVCGDEGVPAFFNPSGFSFLECPADGTVFMSPVPTDDALQAMYNSDVMNRKGTRTLVSGGDDFEFIRESLPSMGGALLDVGCSNGSFLATCSRHFTPSGVELCAETAKAARERGFSVFTGRLEELPEDASYRIVTMLQLVEHVVDPRPLLATAHRVLEAGGYLYLATPAVDSLSFQLFRDRHTHVGGFGHVALYSKPGLTKLVEQTGFELIAHEHYARDVALHDLGTWVLRRDSFRHRMAAYSPRLFHFSGLVEHATMGAALNLLPRGNGSYQRALFKRV